MFTGIIKGTGNLETAAKSEDGARLTFSVPETLLDGAAEGDSMSVSGVCLTMLNLGSRQFSADVSNETLAMTTLGGFKVGTLVNLEPALRAGDRMGGHMVSGHVDGIVSLISRVSDGHSEHFEFAIPKTFERYVARKGSVCLDGVSLTVNEVMDGRFKVCIIPHTALSTTFGSLRENAQANLEVDLVARYLERLVGQESS